MTMKIKRPLMITGGPLKYNLRLSIATKLLVSFLLVSIISLVILGYFTFYKMNQIGQDAEDSSVSLGEAATADGTRILEALGESSIEQKAKDVANQVGSYLAQHPVVNPAWMMYDSDLVKIALQPVGETGYTSLHEAGTAIMRMHPNPDMINFDMKTLKEKSPSVWDVFQLSLTMPVSSGYYAWQDPDGKIRDKYVSHVAVKGTTFVVGATTYIDEFSRPVFLMENRIAVETSTATDRIQSVIDNARTLFIIFLAAVIAVVAGMVVLISRMITRPLKALAKGSEIIGKGNLDYKVEIHTGDELEGLANSFNKMSSELKNFTAELRRTTAEKERVEKELEIARGIQQSFLPETAPVIAGIDLAAMNQPAKEVGGDFYDFIPVGTERWGLVIADVSGKGVPAALFMALSRTLVRANVNDMVTVSDAIRKTNDLITENDRSNMFVTLFYGVLDPGKMTFTYVSAGHNPPFMLRKGNKDIIMLKARGVALGVVPDIGLEEKQITLNKGDVVVLYTDGVTEAINDKEEQFGTDRLVAITEQNRELPAIEIMQRIKDGVVEFSQGQPQFDDITLMILKVK
jgi:serine phosphatase RsbU (regulator of sigma subunit)